ncbi:methyl-accepting chemotaxis protein (MCP) signaling protein [Anoxybacillus vitaminiphilus]|uniref:Methyl-accepting chemotaxis protein (MCP) signaling protein n=1 Tax=Paranoxybacillus vitaminiphilus TaxID=581036 RepID=A0A327Y2R8_9BACL|nr:methyl-accepting chemotaxis protein [Anoxybacillus vitaminiphilus]RAK15044.1 methyl-accepting chemotaxis protein (MCP) signaling protein [Anoxybacillus vitaminiphilus]
MDILQKEENVLIPLLGNHFRILVVNEFLEVQYSKDFHSEIDLPEIGFKLPGRTNSATAIREKRVVSDTLPKEVMGTEVRTIAVPFEDGSGAITIAFNAKEEHEVVYAVEQMLAATEEITASSQSIYEHAIEMRERFNEMSNQADNGVIISQQLQEIYQQVKSISEHLKLISLNALIEAAHADRHGYGFSVVAKEVRNLAEQAVEHMRRVKQISDIMSSHSSDMVQTLETLKEYVESQTCASKDISASIETVTENTKQLFEQASKLLRIDERNGNNINVFLI